MTQATYTDLRAHAAYRVQDVHFFTVTGDDADMALSQFLTKDNEFSEENTASYQFALDDRGEVLAAVIVYKFSDHYLLISKQDLTEILTDSTDFDDFSLKTDESLSLIQIEGAQSPQLVADFYKPYDIQTLEFHSLTEATFHDVPFTLARFGFSGEFGYQIVLESDLLADFLTEILNETPVFDETLEQLTHLEVGQPLESLVFDKNYHLAELGYLWNIDFSKENFRGKEAVEQALATRTRKVVGVKSDEAFSTGDLVLFGDKEVGKVILALDNLNSGGGSIGLALLTVDFAVSSVHFVTSEAIELISLSSPFSIPESW